MAYDNRSRSARAQQTRSRVLTAAGTAFLQVGYASTTIRAIADRAGVSQETIYKTFGSKAALLKAVYDVALAGDDEPIPLIQRPEYREVGAATTPQEGAAAYGALSRLISSRVGPLMRIVLGARGTDRDLDAFVATIDGERLIGATKVVEFWDGRGWLAAAVDAARARDMVWTLNSPGVYVCLMDREWDDAAYETWLAATILATILTN